MFDRIIEIYKFVPFDLDDVKLIIKTLAEVEIDDEVILYIHKNANRLRQIIKFLTKIENIAKTNDYKVITKKELGV